MRVILASGSPRRSDILGRMGIEFSVVVPKVEESIEGISEEIVVENARRKARAVSESVESGIVISADTVVVCRGEILGKPDDRDDAGRMIKLQMDHPQDVYSGVCVIDVNRGREFYGFEISTVEMVKDRESKERAIEWRNQTIQNAFQKGLLLLGCGENTVRFCPPLTVSKDEIDVGLSILEGALRDLTG